MLDDTFAKVSSWRPRHEAEAMFRNRLLIDFIYKEIPQTLLKYSSIEWSNGQPSENAPIWVCWLDGPNDLPDVVSRCVRSVCDHSAGHPVRFIDFNNISKYVSIPKRITSLLDDGRLNLANFCDILRLMLLYEHGGLWLDADIFVSKDIPEDYFSKPFATTKNNTVDIPHLESLNYVGKERWHISIFGGQKGNSLFGFILDAFMEYFAANDELQCYHFMDYSIELARRKFPQFAAALKDGAVHNGRHRKLGISMKNGLPQSEYEDAIPSDTVFNVLNWRRDYPLLTEDGEATVYSAFLNNPKADADHLLSLR